MCIRIGVSLYVGNRIAATLELHPASAWRRVPTSDNPADCASRGTLPQQLIQHKAWWEGPPWLRQDPSLCPPPPVLGPACDGLEIRATTSQHQSQHQASQHQSIHGRKCIICRQLAAKPTAQLMGQLPPQRVGNSRSSL